VTVWCHLWELEDSSKAVLLTAWDNDWWAD
jgi:hypothetical protein